MSVLSTTTNSKVSLINSLEKLAQNMTSKPYELEQLRKSCRLLRVYLPQV